MAITFCGHAEISEKESVRRWLFQVTENCIQNGECVFYLGGYGAFDRLAAAVLQEQKTIYPQIQRILVLPYLDIKPDLSLYDDSLYPPLEKVPRRYAIPRRNQWMIDSSNTLIAYIMHDWGGAYKTADYAQKKEKAIIFYPNIE